MTDLIVLQNYLFFNYFWKYFLVFLREISAVDLIFRGYRVTPMYFLFLPSLITRYSTQIAIMKNPNSFTHTTQCTHAVHFPSRDPANDVGLVPGRMEVSFVRCWMFRWPTVLALPLYVYVSVSFVKFGISAVSDWPEYREISPVSMVSKEVSLSKGQYDYCDLIFHVVPWSWVFRITELFCVFVIVQYG